MTEKMKTIKIEEDIHRRLATYRRRLQFQRDAFCTFGEAIDDALEAAAALEALKEAKVDG